MPEIKYRRLTGDEPETVSAFGKTFKAGEFVEVSDTQFEKAKGNPTFQVKGEKSFGDDGVCRQVDTSFEAEERRARAAATEASAAETKKAKQAESRGGSHHDDRV